MMNDLISRQDAIDAINALFPVDPMKSEYAQGIACGAALAKTYVEQLPSAQPEIIRCKNCTWWSNDEYRECSSPNYDNVHVTPAGFYCGWAERRTDG